MELQRVSGKGESPVQNAPGERLLNSRAMLSHYAHLKNGRGRNGAHCQFCKGGLQSVVSVVENEVAEDGVDESDRGDEEGAAPPPPDNGEYWKPEG